MIFITRWLERIVWILPTFLLISCGGSANRMEVDLSGVSVEHVQIHRYGAAIFSLDTTDLQAELKKIQPNYPVFLDGDLDDPGTVQRMRDFLSDPILIEANQACLEVYPSLEPMEQQMTNLFRHLKYHYPQLTVPKVYTYVSGYDFEYPIHYYNNNLLIGLDMYLGAEYPTYKKIGVPLYMIQRFNPFSIRRDCAYELGKATINYRKTGKQLLDFMINEGKLLWFVKAMNPDLDDAVLFHYTLAQLDWAADHEGMVWAFMIENEVLYSSDPDYVQKLILEAPFTAYFGNESAPRMGAFIGYRIVDTYMQKNPGTSLPQLMQAYDSRKILKLSKYKPDY